MFNPFVKEGVDVTSDQIAPPIVLLAFPAGTLHGVVVNSEGVAIPDFRIKARSRVKNSMESGHRHGSYWTVSG